MEPNEATMAAQDFTGFWDFAFPWPVFLALMVIPFWKIWQRTGHSGAWGLLALVPFRT